MGNKPDRVLTASLDRDEWLQTAFTSDELPDVGVSSYYQGHLIVEALQTAMSTASSKPFRYEFTAAHMDYMYYVFSVDGQLVGLLVDETNYTEEHIE